MIEIPDELLPCVMDFWISYNGQHYHITRYDNHHYLIPSKQWVVVWSGEFYLCRGEWQYKVYSAFASPAAALAALRACPHD